MRGYGSTACGCQLWADFSDASASSAWRKLVAALVGVVTSMFVKLRNMSAAASTAGTKAAGDIKVLSAKSIAPYR